MAIYQPRPPVLKSFECGIHSISYKSERAGCPVCSAEREVQVMRRSLEQVQGQLEHAMTQIRALKVQTDIVSAIREAADTLGDDDLVFLKAVLYEWRDQKSVALKTTHGARIKRRGPGQANGFIALPRRGEPYGHNCSSIGGVAIASYFDEATNTVGPAKAMEFLVKGLSEHLSGGITHDQPRNSPA